MFRSVLNYHFHLKTNSFDFDFFHFISFYLTMCVRSRKSHQKISCGQKIQNIMCKRHVHLYSLYFNSRFSRENLLSRVNINHMGEKVFCQYQTQKSNFPKLVLISLGMCSQKRVQRKKSDIVFLFAEQRVMHGPVEVKCGAWMYMSMVEIVKQKGALKRYNQGQRVIFNRLSGNLDITNTKCVNESILC